MATTTTTSTSIANKADDAYFVYLSLFSSHPPTISGVKKKKLIEL